MPRLTIDSCVVEVPAGATVLDAARRLGLSIPTLCHRAGCNPETSCLVCVVRINGSARLVPSCATEARDGMVVESETPEVLAARRAALELLLGDHLGDCVGPCQTVCPADLDIPKMIALIRQGRLDDAVALTKRRIPIPAILGRICPAMCERGCRRGSLDQPVSIRLLKRLVGDYDLASGRPWQPVVLPSTGQRVAIVGGGPAGLTAAYYLRCEGHRVTIFERREQVGGGLRTGVSPQTLPPTVLAAELQTILSLGIELRAQTEVGHDVSLKDLCDEFDAVLLACGELAAEQATALSLQYGRQGLAVDRSSLLTSMPGVFAAGSSVTPSQHAVRAVGSGRFAALAISRYLAHETPRGVGRPWTVRLGNLQPDEQVIYSTGASAAERITPTQGETGGYGLEEGTMEAARCLKCACAGLNDCRLRYWAMACEADPRAFAQKRRLFARDISHNLVVYEAGKCIACGLCVQIAARAKEPLGLTFIGRGFDVRLGVPWGECIAAGLQQVAAECARACPTGALVLKERHS